MNPVGVLCALPEEAVSLCQNGLVLALSGMGKVNAAMAAQKIISEHKVRAIIFTGVAGGVNPALKVGDVVIATKTFQHDYGFYGSEFKPHAVGRLPEIGIGKDYKPLQVSLDISERILNALQSVVKDLQAVQVNGKDDKPSMHIGTIATGDQFIANVEKRKWLMELGADAVEMEGAAVVQVAHLNKIPVFLIRTISDQADHQSHFDFKNFVSAVSVNHAALVKALLSVI